MFATYGNWLALVSFFALWAVMSGVWFGLVSVPKRTATPSMRSFLETSAMLLSICTAAGIMIGLNCESIIRLSLADPACHGGLYQFGLLSFLQELIPFR
jgi:hypothetical protein